MNSLAPQDSQFRNVYVLDPVTITYAVEGDQPITIQVQAWREENAFIGKESVSEGRADFRFDHPQGTLAVLVLERGVEMGSLRLKIDVDGDGRFEEELPPTEWAEGRERPLIALRLPTLHYFLRQAWPYRPPPPAAVEELIAAD